MDSVIQPLLANTEYRSINAWREFTLLLLPLLSRKLRKTVPALILHPPVLAHTIYQALTFDTSLRDESFELGGTSAAVDKEKGEVAKWQGISEVILGRKEWFEAWMEGERACKLWQLDVYSKVLTLSAVATDQYMEIISSQDAWLIAEDSTEAEEESPIDRELKPTNSARRVKALVEQVTGGCTNAPSYRYELTSVQTATHPFHSSSTGRVFSSPSSSRYSNLTTRAYRLRSMHSRRSLRRLCGPSQALLAATSVGSVTLDG